jgi:GNAT superfamily N-acetyltransferase
MTDDITSMGYAIRWALPEDAEGIVRVVDQTYSYDVEKDADGFSGWTRHVGTILPLYRVLCDHDRVIAICKTGARRLQLGSARITSAEVSELSVLPEFQGRGLGTLLMRDLLDIVAHREIGLLRLNSRRLDLLPFYSTFGFFRFESRTVHLEVARDAGTANLASVRPFKTADAVACAALHNDFNADFAGSLLWDPSQGTWEHPYRLVYETQLGIQGYLYAVDSFGSVGFIRDQPESFDALLQAALRQAAAEGVKTLSLKLPQDPQVLERLESMDVQVEFAHTMPEENVNLLNVHDLATLLSQMAPELERRLAASAWGDWTGTIRVTVGPDSSVNLAIRHGRIAICATECPDCEYVTTMDQFMRMVLGQQTPDRPVDCLASLFPPLVATAGSEIWGADNLDLTQYSLSTPQEQSLP